jgi:UDPglucose 6-dehydrogenase
MIQDVAEKNGNMNVDVVTGALERSTQRIISKAYLKAGMGDGGGCHPRDNIALRWLSKDLGLGYDLFDMIMRAREVQCENIARKLVDLSNEHSLPIVILGKSFKPDVEFIEGSTGILTGYYVEQLGSKFEFDTEPKKAIYLLSHMGKFHDYPFPEGSVVLDVWRKYVNPKIKVVYYGYYK